MTGGYVVAGGRSSRMGQDKALLPYGRSTLLEHAASKLRHVAGDVRILCGPMRRYADHGLPVIEDAICGVGPLGGLYSALLDASTSERAVAVWLAVDLPLVPTSLLSRLVKELDESDVAMARSPSGLEPLCAAFRVEPTLAAVRRALLDGQLKITDALGGLTLQAVDSDAASFANINSTDDYERL